MKSAVANKRSEIFAAARAAGWLVPDELALSEYDLEFLRIEMTGERTRDYYTRRIAMLGFKPGGWVLDAACGIGQWSTVLAGVFDWVLGIDVNAERIAAARMIAPANGRENCEFQVAALEKLPVADRTFDAVFCYGAFMFTDMPRTLAEFHRVLRPGGRLYLNANSTGWCAHLLVDRGLRARNADHFRSAARMVWRTLRGRTSQIVVRRRWLENALTTAGFRVLAIGAEGTLYLNPASERVAPAYPERFYGLPGLLEVVAER